MRWSDPFEQLSVGERFESAARTVRDTDVIVFSALTGDWHPQHCDPRWAAASPFGERIAHGMLVLSLAVGLVPLDPERVLALRRVSDVVFKRPVRLDESISVCGEITALRPVDERSGLVDFGWRIRNQDGALVCRAGVQVLWRRRGGVERESRREPSAGAATPDELASLPL
jgi:3-hydroxybutyryl-CoA dehydratase